MKIIDAHWEKRNLGVKCSEIIIENDDSLQDLKKIDLNNSNYYVVKIPTGKIDYIEYFTNKGFYFFETISELCLDINNYILPSKYTRFDSNINYNKIINANLNNLENELKKGIFKTDRIALDNFFGIKFSAKRYFNWILDEIKNEAEVFELLYNNEPIGFFTLKKIDEITYYNFLAGMYDSNLSFGLGFSIITKPIEEISLRNGKYLTVQISSNNLAVSRLYSSFGFIQNNISYIMIKHLLK